MKIEQRIKKLFESHFSNNFLNVDFEKSSLDLIIKELYNNNVLVLFFEENFSYDYKRYHYYDESLENPRIQLLSYMEDNYETEIKNLNAVSFENRNFEIDKYFKIKAIIEDLIPSYSKINWGYKISEENKGRIEKYYRMCFQRSQEECSEEKRLRIAFLSTEDPFEDIVFKTSLVESINKISGLDFSVSDITQENMVDLKEQLRVSQY